MKKLIMIVLVLFAASAAYPQVGDIIWEDDFDNLDNWSVITGNGNWGWGNGELQYYHGDNVSVAEIPGEEGNNALRIVAKEETGPDIVDQWGDPLSFTSGKLDTKGKVAVQYGMIETRIRVPDLNLGGWPAFWMLGTSSEAWPKKGELDIMEMGHHKAFRDLHDTHNGGNGNNNSDVNQMVSANAIYFSEDAQNSDNPSGAAGLAWDPNDNYCRPYYSYEPALTDRFIVYRMYWDQSSIRFTVVDEGEEHDLYTAPFTFGSDIDEFNQPFYFITNLAVGGNFTDAQNLGDPDSGDEVSMPFPAEMYVDYVRVYKWNGQGEVQMGGPTAEHNAFGVYTDETPVDESLDAGVTSNILVWDNTLTEGSIDPYEGDNVISWTTAGAGWFGAGIMSSQAVDLSAFEEGNMKFMIKIPADVTFKIGIIDNEDNQNYVTFPAYEAAYGLERDGAWGQATIPVTELRGTSVDLTALSYEFVILEEDGASCEFAIDDIYWMNETVGLKENIEKPFSLDNSFPNPFNDVTSFRYSLEKTANVKIEIFNAFGERVKTLVDRRQAAGAHLVSWKPDGQKPGVYFCRFTAGGAYAVQKCILAR